MSGKPQTSKKRKAFLMRLERHSFADISRELKISARTVSRWENGWINAQGRRYKGWKKELEEQWEERNEELLQSGLMVKQERLKTYDRLAQMAIQKIEEQFPNITAKTPADAKALLSEIRELCRLISIEKGEYPSAGGNQTLVAVKTDISLNELQERYRNVQGHNKKDTD